MEDETDDSSATRTSYLPSWSLTGPASTSASSVDWLAGWLRCHAAIPVCGRSDGHWRCCGRDVAGGARAKHLAIVAQRTTWRNFCRTRLKGRARGLVAVHSASTAGWRGVQCGLPRAAAFFCMETADSTEVAESGNAVTLANAVPRRRSEAW